MKKIILVTGNQGFLGSNVCKKLNSLGYDVSGIDNLRFGSKENTFDDFYEMYYGEYDNVSAEWLSDCYAIVHCATWNIIAAQTAPVECIENNTLRAIELFNRFNGKVINISTASVYGDATNIPTREADEIKCSEAYSLSKRMVELYLHKRGNFTTIRPANFYGTNQRNSAYCGVMSKFIQCAIEEKPMPICGDGAHTRSYMHVDDVVNAVIKAVELPPLNTEINIGSNIEITSLELCKLIWKIVDKPIQYTIMPERKIDTVKRRALNCDKAKELLGWEATTSLEEGIKKTILWQESL